MLIAIIFKSSGADKISYCTMYKSMMGLFETVRFINFINVSKSCPVPYASSLVLWTRIYHCSTEEYEYTCVSDILIHNAVQNTNKSIHLFVGWFLVVVFGCFGRRGTCRQHS